MTLELNEQELTSFIFEINLIPDFKYKLTGVNIPSMTIGTLEEYPVFSENRIPIPGTSITYNDLNLTFIVDKKMNNYYYIYSWMRLLIEATRFEDEHQTLYSTDPILQDLKEKEYSDALLFIYTGDKLDRKIRFKNIFPFQLSEIQLVSTESYKISTCQCVFKYESFDFID
jgi:hypothetical protein